VIQADRRWSEGGALSRHSARWEKRGKILVMGGIVTQQLEWRKNNKKKEWPGGFRWECWHYYELGSRGTVRIGKKRGQREYRK